jgi:hypothetical protein
LSVVHTERAVCSVSLTRAAKMSTPFARSLAWYSAKSGPAAPTMTASPSGPRWSVAIDPVTAVRTESAP